MRPRQSSLGIGGSGWAASGSGWDSFNEAEAIKPRNHIRLDHLAAVSTASMRPRQSSLGIWRKFIPMDDQTGVLQ